MADGHDVVVAEIDFRDLACGCRGDLRHQLVCEHLAKVLVLFDFVANLDEPFFNGGLFRAFTKIWQSDSDLSEISADHHLAEE